MARAYITITIATLLRPDYPRIGTEAAAELVRPSAPFRAIPSHRWPSRSPILLCDGDQSLAAGWNVTESVRSRFGLWDGSRLPTSTEPVAIGSQRSRIKPAPE